MIDLLVNGGISSDLMRFLPFLQSGEMCFPVIEAGNEVNEATKEVNKEVGEAGRRADASECGVQETLDRWRTRGKETLAPVRKGDEGFTTVIVGL